MAVAGVMALNGNVFATDYSSWAKNATIALSTTVAGVATDQTNFPVLVRLVDGSNGFNFSDLGNADGRDIRFTDTVGTDLSYQIERCATPYAEVWVLVPLVKGTTSGLTTHIKMYWGKPGQTTTGSGSAVFSTTNGFIGVYHLSEGGTGTRYNSAQSSYNGTTVGYGGTESGNGDIALGDSLKAVIGTDYINLGAGIAPTGNNITLSAWVKPHTYVDFAKIINKAYTTSSIAPYQIFCLDLHNGDGKMEMALDLAGAQQKSQNATALALDSWNYVAGTYDQVTMRTYLNANADGTNAQTGAIGTSTMNTLIGGNDAIGATQQHFNGVIDEVRIENVTRSADWIKLCYQSQMSGATWLTFQQLALSAPAITTQPQSQSKYVGQSVTFTVVATGNPVPTYQWRKGGVNITGATTASYTIASIALGDAGTYDVVATNSQGSATSNGAVLTLCAITLQPTTISVAAGQPATFTVAVSGSNPTYQWQNSTNSGGTWGNVSFGAGGNSATFSFTPAPLDSGEQFRCQVTTGCGSIASSAAICNVCTSPVITGQPQNQGVQAGQQVTFTISASAATSFFQWQRSNDNGSTWKDTGSATSSYTFTTALSDNGAQFRCKAINACATVYSSAAVLSVCTPASIVTSPTNQSAVAGQAATFTVSGNANGSGTLSYLWQYSIDGGVTWGPVSGNGTLASYSFVTASTDNGSQYRCQVSNGCGTAAVSTAAVLTVCTSASITANPTNQSVVAGLPATFSVTAGGSGTLAYQWQQSTNGGLSYNPIGGATSATYSFTALAGQNQYLFRCQASNGCGSPALSSAAILTVCVSASITTNPAGQSVISGQTATFTAAANGGTGLYYQWQQSTDGGTTFNDIAGAALASYSFTTAMGQNGYKYRCGAAVPGCGSIVYSTAATLNVCTPPAINANPANQSVTTGSNATFTAAASGSGTINYQWQQSADGGATWNNVTGATAATYAFPPTAGQNGYLYRCVASNGCGSAAISASASLTVCSQPAVTVNPVDITNDTAGHTATFTVGATGTPSLSYQWQQSTDGGLSWNAYTGAITPVLTFTSATGLNGSKYRCVVSTGCLTPATSAAATLSVCTPPAITSQPVSQPGKQVGDVASFGLTVAAAVTSPSYQWQRSNDSAKTWINVTAGTGATTASYSFTVAAGDATAQFRCNVSSPCGQMYSIVVSIGVCTTSSISGQPANQAATAGQAATFTIVAGGNPAPSYQWQWSSNAGVVWTNVTTGGTSAAYTFATASNQDGWLFRCTASNGCGVAATSSSATLSVCTPPQVVSEPGNQNKNLGDTATFGVTATGNLLSYQWQRSPDGVTWTNATAGTGVAAATYRLACIAADNGARFRCVVLNGCGKDSSLAATLAVCSPPSITFSPKDTSVVTGGTATFTVGFAGTSPAYQWQKSVGGLVWTDTAGATAASFSITAKATDNGLKVRCHITSKCGDITSAAATLTVCDPIAITAQTVANDTVISGSTVVFSVTAAGTSPTYRWERKGAADTAFAAIGGASFASYAFVAQPADSGARYHCVAGGSCGAPITSAASLLTVYTGVHAAFSASAVSGQVPIAVAFADSSTGNFAKRAWDFGDGSVDSSSKNPLHNFTRAGNFTVRLTVTGPGGTDSASKQIFAYNPGANPIQIKGVYASPQKIRITLTGYNSITPPSTFPPVNADSVGIWYKVSAWPASQAQSTFLGYYSLAVLRAKGASFTDSIAVPALSGKDSVYGLMTGILWTDKTITPFDSGNGALVLMRDTMPVLNPLLISGVYVPDDTARISLANVGAIDTARVDSVGIWYSLATDTVNFKDNAAAKWFSAADLVKGGAGFALSVVNTQFNNEEKTMYAAVELHGKNARYSPVLSTSFPVGKKRPHNPIHLTARALSSSRIRLSWNNVSQTGIERIKIWYRTGSPLPLSSDVTSLKLDSLVPAVSDTAIEGNKFSEKTRYFFGAQVFAGGLWSLITDSSSATDSTLKAGDTLPSNSAQVMSIVFDTSVNEIKVRWSVNVSQAESLQVGILYSADSLPTVSTGEEQVIDVKSAADSAYVNIRGAIMFNHTYYVGLWLRRSDGAWTRPSPAGFDSVHVPAFTWQSVVYFSKQNDTVFAFNNEVRLLNTPGDSSITHNTLYYYTPAPVMLAGFVPTGIGFSFKNQSAGVPFYVGIKVDTIPPGYSLSNVRIYRQTATGAWLVVGSPVLLDTVGRYVYVLTNQLDLPFVAMVDTTHPRASVLPGAYDLVAAGQGFSDTIVVRDHLSNVSWWLRDAKGGSSLAAGDISQSGTLSDTLGTIAVSVPGGNVSPDNGVRVILYLSDGSHLDSVDLSRSVVRDTSGIVRTVEQTWTPLATTMILDTQDIKSVLTAFTNKGTWKYDNTVFRIFRWLPGPANLSSTSKWVEFSDSGAPQFRFARASLLWIKTRLRTDIRFGRGITPPLSQSFALKLVPGTWTDFALPFKFDITLGDILAATKTLTLVPDSLQFYEWHKDNAGRYRSEARFIFGIDSLSDKTTVLSAADGSGFSVFNTFADTVTLVIPPVPQAMSNIGVAKKAANTGNWALRITALLADSTPLTSVYCGYGNAKTGGVSYYPQAPSLVNAYVGVFDPASRRVHGHAMVHSVRDGGASYLLVFGNESDKRLAMSYRVENAQTLSQGMSAKLYNPEADSFENVNGRASVAVGAGAKEFRWLFAGTAAYLAKARELARPSLLRFVGTYPNPFRSYVRIRYSLPYEGVDRVLFSIYDMRGKTVWQTQVTAGFMTGNADLMWNARSSDGRPVAAGVYVVSMRAIGKAGKPLGVFERKMTMIR
jgi:PKD repeat protein